VTGQPLLELDDVHSYYGNIHALRGVSPFCFFQGSFTGWPPLRGRP